MNLTVGDYREEIKKKGIRINKLSKYHAKKTERYGHVWDSKKELEEYEKLLVLQRSGEISEIQLQPKFELQPSFKYHGKTQRAITYKADFKLIYPDGHIKIVEVKGFKTRDYVIRKKMFLFSHPEIDFEEIL